MIWPADQRPLRVGVPSIYSWRLGTTVSCLWSNLNTMAHEDAGNCVHIHWTLLECICPTESTSEIPAEDQMVLANFNGPSSLDYQLGSGMLPEGWVCRPDPIGVASCVERPAGAPAPASCQSGPRAAYRASNSMLPKQCAKNDIGSNSNRNNKIPRNEGKTFYFQLHTKKHKKAKGQNRIAFLGYKNAYFDACIIGFC